MRGSPTGFWGKLRHDAGETVVEWHPLFDHCCDVAAVAEALLQLSLWRGRMARLAGLPDLDEATVARLCVFALLHDFGKLTIPFQAKGRTDLGNVTGGHVEEARAALDDGKIAPYFGPLGGFGDGGFGLLASAIAHHGRPCSSGAHQASRWAPRGGLDPLAGLAALIGQCQERFPAAFREGPPLPESPELEHVFAGLVMLADWLGSDTSFFPFGDAAGDRLAFARSRAREIVAFMGLDVPLPTRHDATGRGPFERISHYLPSACQRAVLALPDARVGSIAVLESETGSGKTEAALAHFVSLFESGEVDGMYFALPTRTAATQIFRRVYEAVARAFPKNPPPVVLAVPGYLRVDDVEGKKLPGFEVLWPDEDRYRYRGWAAEGPKRYLAGAVVVGTVDQILLTSLMVSHANLRATSLLRHLLVVDEVHASDAYMNRILEDVLERHARAGGHALLLSATLGAEARARLLQTGHTDGHAPTLAEAIGSAYPLVCHRSLPGTVVQAIAVTHDGREREIAVSLAAILEDETDVARRALVAARGGAKVLVIRNTVADCVATQEALEALTEGSRSLLFSCRGAVAPHHGRFSRVDRSALDNALEEQIGKERPDGGCVVVATQTVQQSLDIDGDLLFTDLCPGDVLLQRIGRLHRHARVRPVGFEVPRAVVLVPKDRDLGVLIRKDGKATNFHGLGSVYPDLRVLEATWRLIESEVIWRIPQMSRSLVERCLHSTALAEIVRECGSAFEAHQSQILGTLYGHRRQADLNLVDWAKPYSETAFPSNLDERIKTRLGEEDRRVCFDPPVAGPFGQKVSELVIRAVWAYGAPSDAAPESVWNEDGVVRFRFGAKDFIYDRLGLRLDHARGARRQPGATDDDGP